MYVFVLPSAEAVNLEAQVDESKLFEVGSRQQKTESMINTLTLSNKLRIQKLMIWGYVMPLAVLMFLENITMKVDSPPPILGACSTS